MAMIFFFTAGQSLLEAKIRSLPPSAYPELPSGVVDELERRACQIPQIQRHKRSNVIQGEFIRPGQADWAVLCMTKQDTSLLVFENGSERQPMEIARNRNTFRSWEIRAVAESFMLNWVGTRKPLQHISHQGISSSTDSGDPNSGRFYDYAAETTVHYFDGEKWIKLGTLVVN
jgi:hypothetical protein